MRFFTSIALLIAINILTFGQNPNLSESEKERLDRLNYPSQTEESVLSPGSTVFSSNSNTGNKGPFDNFVVIGNGATYGPWPVSYLPWANFWEDCKTQTLYLASELGAATTITGLQWDFERISTTNNQLKNVVIKIKTTSATTLTAGAYADMTGASTVYTNALFIPATAVGWGELIDIADFSYNGTDNLIVEILWGNNGNYANTYFRTKATDSGTNRTIYGYEDDETPPDYDGISTYIPNIRFYYENVAPPPPPAVPLSNWAFALIGLAAVSFLVFKFRK